MRRVKNLNRYQQCILLLLVVMVLIFSVAYSVVTSRVGFLYKDTVFIPIKRDGNTVYEGTLQGTDCYFSVTPENAVTFCYGTLQYGPYTAREDPTAIPKDDPFASHLSGIEVKDNGNIVFRGGIFRLSDSEPISMLVNEDGNSANLAVSYIQGNGITLDMEGNEIDPIEPSVITILHLIDGPKLTNKGDWKGFFCCVFLSLVTAISILYTDELFRWSLSFQIRNADRVEPSDWEIAGRYISWTIITLLILWLYIIGLR